MVCGSPTVSYSSSARIVYGFPVQKGIYVDDWMQANDIKLNAFSAGRGGSMTHFIGVELVGMGITRGDGFRLLCSDLYIPKQMTLSVTDSEWNKVQKAKELLPDAGSVGFYFLGEGA